MPLNPFAEALTEFRELAGLTQTQLAQRAQVSVSSVNRWEHGHSPPKRDNAEKLDTACEADGKLLVVWHAQTSRSGLPEWARDLAAIEPAARHATLITSSGVPGMLQAPEYARAVFLAGSPTSSEDDLARLVALRCDRLAELPDLRIAATFPATAVGGLSADLRGAQAKHLLSWAETGRVTLTLAPPGAAMPLPVAPLMVYRLRSGERIIASDHADGTVVLNADSTERVDAVVTAALTNAMPVASSLEYLESLT
ncbi:Scr1 family TA system antitoxin-like transcriptional regulator [Nocardiopsis sp. N85]|uniref:helix-turn-helix domain-containing protein n=1 Tax=Nocardiopsis sp. N85 TaxID=3029400 RepID=UPI00237F8464|nr:Scr1 family TA system antitoxin-like transcriptional regulator [Nocardiopsis sp. N85]MDE3720500.1 Scr1 family TA system antitoxin-like transcriptional regulator [Nocardiopsis sp. N85]